MARMNINPTRMELTKLKNRLRTARRGHKLLKDKRDEMMKQFLNLVRRAGEVRAEIESVLGDAYKGFSAAGTEMSSSALYSAMIYPSARAEIEVSSKNIMSVDVPVFDFFMEQGPSGAYTYGFADTSPELDVAADTLGNILPKLIELSELEKSVYLLADEIERTRRRVNALEHIQIPMMEETIRYIIMKLDENERSNLSRLMKVKDMMVQETIQARQEGKQVV